MADQCRIVVFASGNGSNFQALIDAIAKDQIPNSKIIRLIVNRGKAYATQRAEKAGIPWEYFNLISNGFQAKGEKDPLKIQESRDKYDAALADKLLNGDYRPDLVVLAGWMYVFGKPFLDPLEAAGIKIINLHPGNSQLHPDQSSTLSSNKIVKHFLGNMMVPAPSKGRMRISKLASWRTTRRASWCTTSSPRWTGVSRF